jgi:hypothetical protein
MMECEVGLNVLLTVDTGDGFRMARWVQGGVYGPQKSSDRRVTSLALRVCFLPPKFVSCHLHIS